MLRRSLAAAFVFVVLGGFVAAETIFGVVTKIDGDKATVTVREKGKKGKGKGKGTEVEVDISKAKFYKKPGKGEAESIDLAAAKELVEKGAKGKAKGALASIDHEEKKVSKMTFISFGGKKKKKDN